MTAFVSNTDDAIVSPLFCLYWRSSAVETQVFSPFSVSLTLRLERRREESKRNT
jgi:hypothetical protein